MKTPRTLIYIISIICCASFSALAQDEDQGIDTAAATSATDTLSPVNNTDRYGLRIGIDLSKPLRSFLDDKYKGLEIAGDFRIKKNYYIAAEIGNENKESDETNFNVTTKGSYIKAGFNYNAYNNWYGMSNLIYVGLRAGFSSFSQELNNYTIYTTNTYYEPDFRTEKRDFSGLNAIWLELQLGVQAEILNNLYLGINLQLKRMVTEKEPDGFGNIYIPGFYKVTTDSPFGVGYGYTLSYFIPIFKK